MDIGNKKVLFTINSNKNYYQITTPKAIYSLHKAGIYDLVVIIGGWGSETDFGNFYATTYDSCDYTTFNYIVDYPDKFKDYTHIFYMHDTSWVGPRFKEYLIEHTPDNLVTHMLCGTMSMNIGMYEIQHLLDNKDKVCLSKNSDNSLESINKWKQWGADNEDYLSARSKAYDSPEEITIENPYGADTLRRTRYFSKLDFYKSQSNWEGVKKQMSIGL